MGWGTRDVGGFPMGWGTRGEDPFFPPLTFFWLAMLNNSSET